ncbi:MAG: hypothetical protein LBD90_09340 [Bifidobacteriaceae bacterium]|nr:hypothetical protein [Bifidobacteriaceae bacterium]
MSSPSQTSTTLELVAALQAEVDRIRFAFPSPATAEAEARRATLAEALAQEVLPGLRRFGQAAVIALVGGTGVGKSALANALAGGQPLSPAGPLRPTTRRPVLLTSPETAAMLGDHPAGAASRLALHPEVPATWAVLDCADPFAAGNDPQTAQPDVPVSAWLVVTSALRYGDALLWDLLQGVGRDGKPIALVVDRVPAGAWEMIEPDLTRRLESLALGYVALWPVPECAESPQAPQQAGPQAGSQTAAPGAQPAPAQTAPQALPPDVIGGLLGWLQERFPPPPQPPDPRPQIEAVARAAAELARDLTAQARAVALLYDATEAQAATIAAVARAQLPAQVDPQVTEVWLTLIGSAGGLATLTSASAASADGRERWGAALAQLGAAVSDAVARDASTAAGVARGAMAAVWRGPGVPSGSSVLLDRAVLAASPPPPLTTGRQTPYRAWSARLVEALAGLGPSRVSATAEALTQAGLLALVQAAALGLPGPAKLAEELLGEQAGPVVEAAQATLRETRSDVARAALTPFRDVLETAGRTPSGTVKHLAERLAATAGLRKLRTDGDRLDDAAEAEAGDGGPGPGSPSPGSPGPYNAVPGSPGLYGAGAAGPGDGNPSPGSPSPASPSPGPSSPDRRNAGPSGPGPQRGES